MGDWIKSRGVNGEWGYLNILTGLFRTTLPDSSLELIKRNDAVIRLHSANLARYEREGARTRNHSSETIKKRVKVPVITSDSQGNFSEGHVTTLAPTEDSVGGVDPLALLYVEGVALGPVLKGVGRGVEYGLARAGNDWARSRIVGRLLKQQVDKAILPKWLSVTPQITLHPGERPIEVSDPYVRWSLLGYINPARNVYPKGNSKQYFQIILDVDNPVKGKLLTEGNGQYSLHFHTDRGEFRGAEKERMFQTLADLVPEGGLVSTWGSLSPGGFSGINRFGKQFGWPQVGTRKVTTRLDGSSSDLPIYLKPEMLAESLKPISKNAYNYDNIPIIGSNLTGTTQQIGNSNFNILGLTYVDGLNLDLAVNEMPRRLKALGYDLDTEMAYSIGHNGRLQRTPANKYIQTNLSKPNYIGNFDKRGLGGTYNYGTGNAYISVGYDADNGLYHERIMHGTDNLIDSMTFGSNKTNPKKMYSDFLDTVFKNNSVFEDLDFSADGRTITFNGQKFPMTSIKWQEARATIGEFVKTAYDAIKRSKGKDVSVADMRKEFEAAIDKMPDDRLLDILKGINSYGNAYATIGLHNPQFIKMLRHMIKTAPVAVTPVLVTQRRNL